MNKLLAEEIYYLMVLGRKFEYAAKENYMKGNISGFLHLDIGQEALSVAAIKAFEKGDVFSTYREHIMAMARGIEPKAVMAELFGKASGVSGGKGGSMHLFEPSRFFYGGDAIVGGHIPNAVGCAYARKYQGSDDGVMVIFGDGATNGGAFFESLNIAATQKLPLLFLCENNEYADAPPLRLAGADTPIPYNRKLELASIPTPQSIADDIIEWGRKNDV
ncbi:MULTISPECIES: thiamine pyrophosphate-dependent enzyme [Sulfurimonas]|uniref:thiamine pyrophosphate-dependent dehydrogenase E1 component subunit alpha n=1 Tax=Sulfurimonas TaxID=202746 RepID=UPI001FEA52B5|nr:thiamine pyrophosphate-dependent enzyme [Sulfurimonas indica]